jgi:hypothetical protein
MNGVISNIGSILTLGLGVMSLLYPNIIATFIGIEAKTGLGRSEVRATYGGFFVGLGTCCLWFQSSEMFLVAGIAWWAASMARILAVFIEKEASIKNFGGIVIEGGIGTLLLSSLF